MSEQIDWLRAYALMGTYLGEQVQIQLGPGGLFYAVLRGQGPTGLQTVMVDGEGRLSAFVIDSSDAWGQMLEVGNAELAARLGSVVQHDRRGQVISATDFSNGYGVWRTTASGDDATIELDPTAFRSGGYSIKCTGIEPNADDVTLFTRMPVLPLATAGLSVFFSIPENLLNVRLTIQYDDATTRVQGIFLYTIADETLDVYHGTTGWSEVASGVTINNNAHSFNYMKLVIDGDEDSYLRVMFNDIEEALTTYPLQSLATAGYAHLYLSVLANMRAGEADVIYLDCPVVTINEPI